MKPVVKPKTVLRVQDATGEPISRGFDSAINKCLDELDELKAKQAEIQDADPTAEKIDCLNGNTKRCLRN